MKRRLKTVYLAAGLFLIMTALSCTLSPWPADIEVSQVYFDADSRALRFTLTNQGSRTVSSFSVRGWVWSRSRRYPVSGSCRADLMPGGTGDYQVYLNLDQAETDLLYLSTVRYTDGTVWRDPAGVFAN